MYTSLREGLDGIGDIREQVRRDVQIPIRACEFCMPHVGRERKHMLADMMSVTLIRLECPYSEAMTKIVNTVDRASPPRMTLPRPR